MFQLGWILLCLLLINQQLLIVDSSLSQLDEDIQNLHDKLRHKKNVSVTGDDRTRPHIVFVFADDLGWNDLGYHSSEIATPTIDALAASGVRLEKHYVYSVCTPSRAAFLTGRYDIHTGFQHLVLNGAVRGGLPSGMPTIAEKMRDAGYDTHAVGKWHVGFAKQEFLPTAKGFQTFTGIYNGQADHYSMEQCSYAAGFPVCGTDFHNDTVDTFSPIFNNTVYSTDVCTHRAVDIISTHDVSNPLFLYLNYHVPHWPLQAPGNYMEEYAHINDTNRQYVAAMTSTLDDGVRSVVRALVDNNMWEDTIFIFASDNGGDTVFGSDNYPLRGEKTTLYDGAVRACAFVTGGMCPLSGVINTALYHVTDWFPTLLHLAGVDTDNVELDGYDIWGSITGDRPSPRWEILHNIDPLWPPHGQNLYPDVYDVRVRSSLLVGGHWKIITGYPDRLNMNVDLSSTTSSPTAVNVRLFDLRQDPYETNNLATEKPWLVRYLLRRLATYNRTAIEPNFSSEELAGLPWEGVWAPWL